MAARTETIEEIRARTDLVQLIADYVPLRKSGRRFIGLCPFHHEKTPSFSVNPEGRFFYCFGCKASGDAFDFIMRLEGLDFVSAAKLLADRVGVKWAARTPDEAVREKQRADLYRLNTMAAEVYRRALAAPQTGALCRNYLTERGMDPGAIARFGIGYAPHGPATLVGVFRRYGCSLQDAAAVGLVLPTADGYIDRFRNRLLFPLVDLRERVSGFGGRVLEQGKQPKYLNSSDSEIFSKGRFLYGLNLTRDHIRRHDCAIVVEGYLDAIATYTAGITNVVASLGTALTEHHAALLKRFSSHAIIAYDGDSAGQAATIRGLEVLRRAGMAVQVAVLPAGRDPDDLVRTEGVESLRSVLGAALPLTDFLLARALDGADLSNPEARSAAVQACLPVLAEVASASARDGYIRRVAREARVHEELIASDLAVYLRGRRKARHIMDNARPDSNTNRCDVQAGDANPNPAERELLRTILKEYSLLARIREELAPEDFAPGPLCAIYRMLLDRTEGINRPEDLGSLPEECRPVLLELLAVAHDDQGPPVRPDALPKCVRRIKADAIRRRIRGVQAEIQSCEGDDGQAELVAAYEALQRELTRYQESGFSGP